MRPSSFGMQSKASRNAREATATTPKGSPGQLPIDMPAKHQPEEMDENDTSRRIT